MISTAVLVWCLATGQAAEKPEAAPPAASKDELAAAVKRLVRQLDDEKLAQREAAEKELVELGPDALPLLPAVTPRTPAEVKDRLGRVRRLLEAAVAVAVAKAAPVTLQGEMPLSKALAELETQSGNPVVDFREEFGQETRDPTIKLDLKNVTFWEAFDKLADQAGVTAYNFSGQSGKLAVVARSEDEVDRAGRAKYDGLFRVEPLRVEAARDLRNPKTNLFQLFVDLSWEPRLRPIVLVHALDRLEAVDENGKSLVGDEPQGQAEINPEIDASSAELVVPLQLPPRSVKKIASLKGQVELLIPGRMETFEFSDLEKLKGAELRRASVVVVVDQVRKNQDVHEVRMRVKFDQAANSLESHRGWIYNNPAMLIDPKGQVVENAGMEATLQEDDEVGVAYQFVIDGGLKGYKFRYQSPSAIIKLPLQYVIEDVDLP